MLNDPLSDVLSNIQNASKSSKSMCMARPISTMIKKVLALMEENHYIGKPEYEENTRGGSAKITLIGRVNKCGAIKPRFSVQNESYEKFEKRFLPAKDFGFLVISTTKGIMTHYEAKEKRIGGKLIAFVY